MTGQSEAKSMLGSITLYRDYVQLKQRDALYWGAKLMNRSTLAPLELPWHSIAGLEFQEATLLSCGYLRIVTLGEEPAGNVHVSFRLKNGVMFGCWEQARFERLKRTLEARLAQTPPTVLPPATVPPQVELLDVTLPFIASEVPPDVTLVEA